MVLSFALSDISNSGVDYQDVQIWAMLIMMTFPLIFILSISYYFKANKHKALASTPILDTKSSTLSEYNTSEMHEESDIPLTLRGSSPGIAVSFTDVYQYGRAADYKFTRSVVPTPELPKPLLKEQILAKNPMHDSL